MSLELAAQHLASRGRKGDSMLVHMAPQEVSGLQALAKAAGGSLTLNPDTGLPEANFLKRMLPMIIGAGITAATGGAAAPWMIGLGLGGAETLRTGSLEKGLMAGLGAYGGAGLAGGLMGAGAAGAGTGLTTTGGVMGANPMVTQPMTFGAETLGTGVGAGSGVFVNPVPLTPSAEVAGALSEAPSLAQNLNLQAQQQAAQSAMNVTPQFATATPPPSGPPTFSQNLSQMGRGLENPSQLMTSGNLKYGLAALAPAMMGGEPSAPYAGSGPNPYEYNYDPNNQQYTRVPPGTRQRDILAPTTQMMAVGGPVDEMSQRNQMETMMANGGQMFAAGGAPNLGDYSDGGRLLKGPGDGVSDSIPATIADKRPARLADGEFVVPARIVSELGNGSTEAGARKLYAMMDRIQQARGKTTGKDRVAVNSRAEKALPA